MHLILSLMLYLWPLPTDDVIKCLFIYILKVEIDTKGFIILFYFYLFYSMIPPYLGYMKEGPEYFYKWYHWKVHHFVPQQYFCSVQPLKAFSAESWQPATASNSQRVSLPPGTRTNGGVYDLPSPK